MYPENEDVWSMLTNRYVAGELRAAACRMFTLTADDGPCFPQPDSNDGPEVVPDAYHLLFAAADAVEKLGTIDHRLLARAFKAEQLMNEQDRAEAEHVRQIRREEDEAAAARVMGDQ